MENIKNDENSINEAFDKSNNVKSSEIEENSEESSAELHSHRYGNF